MLAEHPYSQGVHTRPTSCENSVEWAMPNRAGLVGDRVARDVSEKACIEGIRRRREADGDMGRL